MSRSASSGVVAMIASTLAAFLGMFLGQTTSPPEIGNDKTPAAVRIAKSPSKHSLTGRFVYDAMPPQPALLDIPRERRARDGSLAPTDDAKRYADLGLRDETLAVHGVNRGVANVIIWISDKRVPIPETPPVRRMPPPAELIFKGGRLQPRVVAWWAPTRSLSLVNDDEFAINLRWNPLHSQSFNVLVSKGKSQRVECGPERLPGKVACDILSWVQPAILFPCAHPFHAVTDSDGKFRIDRLPPGEWEFAAWHERRGYLQSDAWPRGRRTLKIDAETTDLGTIKLAPSQFVVQKAGDGSGASDVRQDALPVAW